MQVILIDQVENLGEIGDTVNVKAGYARNFLLPQGKALLVTPENMAEIEARRAELEKKAADLIVRAKGRARELDGKTVTVVALACPEGKLFGSVGPVDIADACTAAGCEINRSEVRLPDGPIRVVGEHAVQIHFHSEVNATINVSVVTEGGTALIDETGAIAGEAAEQSADEIAGASDESGSSAA